MKQFFENEIDDLMGRNNFQRNLDFFYERYRDLYPTRRLGS